MRQLLTLLPAPARPPSKPKAAPDQPPAQLPAYKIERNKCLQDWAETPRTLFAAADHDPHRAAAERVATDAGLAGAAEESSRRRLCVAVIPQVAAMGQKARQRRNWHRQSQAWREESGPDG